MPHDTTCPPCPPPCPPPVRSHPPYPPGGEGRQPPPQQGYGAEAAAQPASILDLFSGTAASFSHCFACRGEMPASRSAKGIYITYTLVTLGQFALGFLLAVRRPRFWTVAHICATRDLLFPPALPQLRRRGATAAFHTLKTARPYACLVRG
jgi:hypothetical protein